ncbi:AgrD family cyclic lactone autoinducer peptide [Thomasclavelia cocleata]|nr:cyclic lactone autoinducer peptide [Thomasclavelia cocleata]
MEKVLKMFSKLVLAVSSGAVSGASRYSDYQPKESETLKKLKKF